MPIPIGKPNISSWSYLSSDGSFQNVSLLGTSYKSGRNNFSVGAGTDVNVKEGEVSTEPIVQLKDSYTAYDDGVFSVSFGARGRGTPSYFQGRGIVNVGYKVNDIFSVYGEGYGTAKYKDGEISPTLSICFGAKGKLYKNLSWGLEGQGNYNPATSSFTTSANAGLTLSF